MTAMLFGWIDWSRTFDVVLGAILAILFAIFVERIRKPQLVLSVGDTDTIHSTNPNLQIQEGTSLRVRVFAKPLYWGTRWMMRAPALQCRGDVSFHHLDGQYLYNREMRIRWTGTPEPLQVIGVDPTGQPITILDPYKIVAPSQVDIAPDEEESLDIVARFDNDAQCYGWSNESYSRSWRNPAWLIPFGRYLVRVSIRSGGQSWSDVFRLINDVPRTDFRLEIATAEDKKKVARHVRNQRPRRSG
jgi:hypothetical protein